MGQKPDKQVTNDVNPDHIAVDETVIHLNDERHWLFAVVVPETNELLHVRLFQTRTTERIVLFLGEIQEKSPIEQATFLLDDAHHIRNALKRLYLGFQVVRHGNRNAIERIFREVTRRISSF